MSTKQKDLEFLKEMKVLSEKILHEPNDITVKRQLDEMIGDWINELS